MGSRRFTRFVVVRWMPSGRYESRWWATGVITHAQLLLYRRNVSRANKVIISECISWFNAWVPVPPWTDMKSRGTWNPDMVSWFYTKRAKEPIRRLQPLIRVLRKYGMRVCKLQANDPGEVVYRDRIQVVASTPPNAW